MTNAGASYWFAFIGWGALTDAAWPLSTWRFGVVQLASTLVLLAGVLASRGKEKLPDLY